MVESPEVKKEKERARMRRYRAEHPDVVHATDRRSWHKTKKHTRRAKTMGNRRCAICRHMLRSFIVRMKQRKYCDGCVLFEPAVKRALRNVYMRRWRQKRLGLPQEEIIFNKK